ncbi:MAG: TolB family protein, partial [Rhodothermia bacterium]
INDVRESTSGVFVGTGEDVWVLDLERQTKLQLTFGGTGRSPTWTAGGDSVAYIEFNPGNNFVAVRAADGSGAVRKLFEPPAGLVDVDISPSGTLAAYTLGETAVGVTRLMIRNLRTGETVDLSGEGDANIRRPRFSPDSRYVAFERDSRIWIRAIDGNGVPVGAFQGRNARWARDGTKIYGAASTNVFAREISLRPTFSITSRSRPPAYGIGPIDLFDVFEDGRTGIFNLTGLNDAAGTATARGDTTVTVQVTVNWFETLE